MNTTTQPFVQEQERQFILYPNPTNNSVNIHIDALENKAFITIIDISGRIVLQQNGGKSNTRIDLIHLNQGMYNVQVFADGKNLGTQKLVIK